MLVAHGVLGTPSPWFGVAAAIVAVLSLLRTVVRDRRSARRTDPELVAAWTSGKAVTDCTHAMAYFAQHRHLLHHTHTAVVRNGGKQPVYEVALGLGTDDPDLMAGEQPYVTVSVGLIPPGETREVDIGCSWRQVMHQEPVELWFTDVRGLRWKRGTSGRLRLRHGYRMLRFSWAARRRWGRLSGRWVHRVTLRELKEAAEVMAAQEPQGRDVTHG